MGSGVQMQVGMPSTARGGRFGAYKAQLLADGMGGASDSELNELTELAMSIDDLKAKARHDLIAKHDAEALQARLNTRKDEIWDRLEDDNG
jgi:hypothetical protein